MTTDVVGLAPGWGPPVVARVVRPWRWAAAGVGALLAGVLAAVAVLAWGTLAYARAYEGRMLPGTEIAGVAVAGLAPDDALAEVRRAIAPQLHREVGVAVGGRRLTPTARELGARSDASRVVAAAAAASDGLRWDEWARLRWLDPEPGAAVDVAIRHRKADVRAFVDRVGDRVERGPRDALLDTSGGQVTITPERVGRSLDRGDATRTLLAALGAGRADVTLPVERLKPSVTTAAYAQVLVLHQSAHRLELYRDGTRTHSWVVATGTGEYPTPLGRYEVSLKRYLPTWVNPSPDGWGATMPASIGPGPGNPLGVRALNWSAPGAIRFHGTQAVESLGTDASHGCVRMSNADVTQLYDLVDVGAVIVSLP